MAAASKLLTTLSLIHFRTLTCSAFPYERYHARLVQRPPDLIEWVRREGGFVHPAVKIAQFEPYGLGLIASQEIPKGSELIALPDHLPLRFKSRDPGCYGGDGAKTVLVDLASRIPEELWAMKLGLRLLQERAVVGSFWWPYISNIPETYSVPIFFPGDDIKNLQYAPLLYQVNKRCRFLLDFEKEIKVVLENVKQDDHPFEGQEVDSSALGWAMSAVSSRAFRLHASRFPDRKDMDIPMLLPLIDMCNHSFDPNAKIVQELDAGISDMFVKVVAERCIRQDDPLVLNYGCLNNDFLLLDYGFVIPSNPYDCIELKYDPTLLDAASMAAGVSSHNFLSPAPWQQEFLLQLNLVGEASDLKVTVGGPQLVEGRFLAALRVLLSGDMEMAHNHDLEELKSLSTEAPFGISNEIAAFRTVIALCVIALEHFPTKIMDDETLLKQGFSRTTDLAIRFRIQKKSLIMDVMRNLARRVKLLQAKERAPSRG